MSKKLRCPECNSGLIIKKGTRRYKFQTIQKYSCKNCGNNFSSKKLKNSTYSARVIMKSLCNYNRGLSLKNSSHEINKKFHVNTYPELISSWLKKFDDICSFKKFRKTLGKSSEDTIFEKEFEHKLPYLFKYHKQKLDLFVNNYFLDLKNYLIKIPEKCPNKLFNDDNFRCSQLKFCSGIEVKKIKNNFASKLAEFALKCIKNNYERHDFVEDFMLFNDSATLAVEVPVWIYPQEIPNELKDILKIDKPLTGHIDILQIRYGLIYILDFKPNAHKEKPEKVASQLFAYALALSIRTGKWLRNFKCAWFDDKNYYVFSPGDFAIQIFEKKGMVENTLKNNRIKKIKNEFEIKKEKIPESILKKYSLNKKAQKYYTGKKFHKKRQNSGEKKLVEKIKDSKEKIKSKDSRKK